MSTEQRFPQKIGWESFPNYLCYGILDDHSKRRINGQFVADYLMQGRKVMEVRLNEKSAEIEEYWDGKFLSMSCYPDLEKAVYYHFSSLDQKNSPIHRAWVSSIAALGNVYVQIIEREQVKQLVYPGVFQQDIYIPVRKDDLDTIDMIRKDAVVKVFQPELLDSVLTWKQRSSGKVIQEEITLVKVQAPVAFIPDIIRGIKLFFYTDKMWRVIVVLQADHSNSYGLKSFFGTAHDHYSYYSLLLK